MFASVLDQLNSPQNVGSIVRTHVAMGGGPLLMIGHERPWRFRKGAQAFSRRLERQCAITHLDDAASFFQWCETHEWTPVGIEIRPDAVPLGELVWPTRPALVFGNERTGLADAFLARCAAVARIPQFGPVGSLNVAMAHGMTVYALRQLAGQGMAVTGSKYPEPPR